MPVLRARKNKLCAFALLLLANYAAAGTIELSAAGGIDWYNKNDTSLVISSIETDADKVSQSSLGASWKIGLGYSIMEDLIPYFHGLLFNFNVYQTATNLSGAVWQFEQAQFNNYNFVVPIKSTRLMVDVRPTFSIWDLEPYAILGVGVNWNSVSYLETANGSNTGGRLVLSNKTTPQLAWNIGVGCNLPVNQFINLSAEYLFAVAGTSSPASDSGSVSLVTPPAFSLQSHSFLAGLSLRL